MENFMVKGQSPEHPNQNISRGLFGVTLRKKKKFPTIVYETRYPMIKNPFGQRSISFFLFFFLKDRDEQKLSFITQLKVHHSMPQG